MDLEFQDRTGVLGAYLKGWEAVTSCELTTTMAAGAVTALVTSTTGFAATGTIYCDQAAWTYAGKTATSFTGLVLVYGSGDVEHVVDTLALPPCQPEVTDGPADLRGRRVVIYAAESVNGVLSTTELQWVGYVDGFVDLADGMVRIPVSHVLRLYREGMVFGWVPTGRLRGLYVPNYPDARWGRFTYYGAAGWADLDIVPDGSATFYASKEALIDAVLDPTTGINSLAQYRAGRTSDGRIWIRYTGAASGRFRVAMHLPELLGYDPLHGGERGWLGTDPEEADVWPTEVFAPLTELPGGFVPRLYLRTGETSWFSTAAVTMDQYDGVEYGIRKVATVTADYLEILGTSRAAGRGGRAWSDYVMVSGGAPPPTIRQVLELDSIDIDEVCRLLWAGQLYAGAAALRYPIPQRWLASPAMRDSDVDWTELRRLVTAAPWDARRVYLRIDEPTEISECITGALAACGIYAYVRNDGSVGWRMAGVPSELDTSTAVGASWIDSRSAAQTETRVGADELVNSVMLRLANIDVTDRERKILIVDQKSLQRYGARPARDPGDPLAWYTRRAREIELHVEAGVIESTRDIETDLARHLAGTLFALLSRPRPVVPLPVTPVARQLAIGAVVDLTTAWAWDIAAGAAGVTAKTGLVLGWTRAEGERAVDELRVMLIDSPLAAIAPAALATAWDAGTKTLTFADTDLYHLASDTSDLSYFEATDVVKIWEYDSLAPTTWTAVVASVSVAAKTMTLTTAPAITVPCVVVFDLYSAATTDQRGEGWIWLADDADGQVEDIRAGIRWG
jgi:hypothetical protein